MNVWSRKWLEKLSLDEIDELVNTYHKVFECWHNERYLLQCFYNLQEKYDCGGMSKIEYDFLYNGIRKLLNKENSDV